MVASLGVGGAEGQVLALAERMASRGHEVTLVTLLPEAKEEWPTGLPLIRLNLRKSAFSLNDVLWRTRRILRDLRPQIVHSHSFHANIIARLACCFRGGPKAISTIHNVYEGGWHRMLAYRLSDRMAAHTTAVSQAAAKRFLRLKAVNPKRCSVVVNAIDPEEFAKDEARRVRIRETLGAGDEFVWIAAGRAAPAKDYPNLLRAFARVLEFDPNAYLWIAGEGSDRELSRKISRNWPECVRLQIECLGLRRDVAALLDGADGFVSGSAWEGMPLAIAEAMAMEKPVVATDVGGVRELVGECGMLVPARAPEALAEAMLGIMRRPEADRRALGRAARSRVQTSFNIESRVDEWVALYNSIAHAEQ